METRHRQIVKKNVEKLNGGSTLSTHQNETFSSSWSEIKNSCDELSESSSSNFEDDDDQRKQHSCSEKKVRVFPLDYSGTDFTSRVSKISTAESYIIELEPSFINETVVDENISNDMRSDKQINTELNKQKANLESPGIDEKRDGLTLNANSEQTSFPAQSNPSKKRQRNPQKWKRKKAALLRESGKSYTSYKGKNVEEKTPNFGMLCNNNCPFQCNKKFDREQREKLFNDFYKLNVNDKNAFLFNCISLVDVQRMRKDAVKHKSSSYRYTVKNQSDNVRVCKTALASLFQIGRGKVDHIQKSIKSGSSLPPPDHRGKHMNRPHRILPEVAEYIEKHISSFPIEESPYSGTQSIQKKYLPPFLSLRKMFQLYKSKIIEDDKPDHFDVAECTYRHIFTTKFNLSFGHPQNDTNIANKLSRMDKTYISNYQQAFDLEKF